MSIHGCSHDEYSKLFSQLRLNEERYLDFRDIPDLLQKYVKGRVALDYGCGTGISAAFLKDLGFLVDGVDISESMVNLARQAMPENNFQVLQEGKIPAEDVHYDLVFCNWVLPEIGPKHELFSTLSEITRVLKEHGILIAVVANEASYQKDYIWKNSEFEENKNLKSGDRVKILVKNSNFFFRDYFWTDKDYQEVLSKVGLDVVVVHHPLGKDDDGIAWINEKEVSPDTIYVAQKKKKKEKEGGTIQVKTEIK